MLTPDAWRQTAYKILRRQHIVQIHGEFGKPDGMIFPRHAAVYIAQQFVVNHWIAGSVLCAYGLQARHGEQRLENILERRNATLEIVHDSRGIPPLVLHALKH